MRHHVVIAGQGEVKQRPASVAEALDPLDLMAEAARRAEAEIGGSILHHVDSVEVIHQITWRYEDTAGKLCERLGIAPPRAVYHPGGGESPLRVLHEAARRVAAGEARIVLICGAEARGSVKQSRKDGVALPWPPKAATMEHPWQTEEILSSMSREHGVAQPTFIYPFYENATAHAWGMSPRQADAESAMLWERYSQVAAQSPFAWQKQPIDAATVAAVGPGNPMIAWPYRRLMVANPTVNLGAAIIVMSREAAIEAGIPVDRQVHIQGGAAADEPTDYLERDRYDHSPAQTAVLEAALELNEGKAFDALELYSCFPCVPKMARRSLGLGEDVVPTVTGGLTFFGGPFNNYMLHATCAMVRRLAGNPGRGLLYGQGDFVTKHHAIVLATGLQAAAIEEDYRVEARAAELRGPVPVVVENALGPANIESFTVLFDPKGAIDRGIVILGTAAGERTLARVPASDQRTIARLMDQDKSPIGLMGTVTRADDRLLEWTLS